MALALLSELVRAVARVEGIDEVTVGIFAQAAREAGVISQKGRGRGAAHMTAEDAANLLIAANGSPLAKNVRATVPAFRSLPLAETNAAWAIPEHKRKLRALLIPSRMSSFGEWLEHAIEL